MNLLRWMNVVALLLVALSPCCVRCSLYCLEGKHILQDSGLDIPISIPEKSASDQQLCKTARYCVLAYTASGSTTVVWQTCAEQYATATGRSELMTYSTRCEQLKPVEAGSSTLQCCKELDCCNRDGAAGKPCRGYVDVNGTRQTIGDVAADDVDDDSAATIVKPAYTVVVPLLLTCVFAMLCE